MQYALSLDYWDTLFDGSNLPARVERRQAALRRMLRNLECDLPDEEFATLYRAAGAEADRWWREEHRGYSADDRIRWMLGRLNVTRPADCEHVAAAVRAVDETLLELPPPMLEGAKETVERLAERFPLAILSDTGFASGAAQDALLAREGVHDHFAARIYSMDIGHAKPRREMFEACAAALGRAPETIIHIGDNERTDVRGALDAGFRAIRLDIVRDSGPSAAELVARSFGELREYLLE
ncbi:MAG TPA: HAD family hydrolase, partial [Gemmatimonadaceae bacterium]|nr:HAD family hydrolase [Gemmatimonadaceae bacterium]